MRFPLRNATNRLILAHFTLIAVATVIALGYVSLSTQRLIDAQIHQVVQAETLGLADDYGRLGAPGLAQAIDARVRDNSGGDAVYLLATARGDRIAGNLAHWPSGAPAKGHWGEVDLYRIDRDEWARVAAAAFLLPGGEQLLVGRDARARRVFEATLQDALASALALMAALSLGIGWLLARFVRHRIDQIAATARDIMRGQFDRRVPLTGAGDEFDRLSGVLNAMLERIDLLVGELRMVTDGLAHDLRSPLTRLRSHLAAAQSLEPDAEARRDRIGRAIEEADRLLTAFTELIAISRAEAGVGRDQFAEVDLTRLAEEVVDLYGPSAEERGATVALRADGSVPVRGHRQFLAQALANLVDNALKHAPPGTEISVAAGLGRGGPYLAVADRGPGVPAADRRTVLKRFAQLDASRGGGGAGLGLALVAAVAKLHGGEISLADNAPGLLATLQLPAEATNE